ncbi:Gmad2 immunoglobulin-like domain-containing protein [Patescibacteria group bacterium]|nr:Gmad2 immunoglobulin-like domain-containing protein [Patescibacteria group bacterium]MBU1895565.1 Gmad2 immunoglobulin-like domain-containing protein [Patescibacteria group bacterium]
MTNLSKLGGFVLFLSVIILIGGGCTYWSGYSDIDNSDVLDENLSMDTSCNVDSDCACGTHKETGVCFFGNSEFVDTDWQCPDFCSGIGGNIDVACVENTCEQMVGDAIDNFDDCLSMGYPIMESYPRQCRLPNGSTLVENIGNELEKSDFIISNNPRPNQIITSPLEITGQARIWYFEGTFPVRLLDGNGIEIATHYVTAQSDWMVEDFVEFSGTLEFENPDTKKGTLIIEKSNASDLSELDDELQIPVRFE